MEIQDPLTQEDAENLHTHRRRLEELFLLRGGEAMDMESFEREIQHLARSHPEIFVEDIENTSFAPTPQGPRRDLRSPLNYLVARHDDQFLGSCGISIDTFEAVYNAHPTAISTLDSCGDTVLLRLLRSGYGLFSNTDERKFAHEALLKAVIEKSKESLAVPCPWYGPPIFSAIYHSESEEMIRYMLEHHPGNPFHERDNAQQTLLGKIVGYRGRYSFDFVQFIFEQYPEAVRVQHTDEYKSTALHIACRQHNEAAIHLMLTAYPQGAFVKAWNNRLPLHELLAPEYGSTTEVPEINRSMIELVTAANPSAVFAKTFNPRKIDPSAVSPFTEWWDRLLMLRASKSEYPAAEEAIRSLLFFLMNMYRHADKIKLTDAWGVLPRSAHLGMCTYSYFCPFAWYLISSICSFFSSGSGWLPVPGGIFGRNGRVQSRPTLAVRR